MHMAYVIINVCWMCLLPIKHVVFSFVQLLVQRRSKWNSASRELFSTRDGNTDDSLEHTQRGIAKILGLVRDGLRDEEDPGLGGEETRPVQRELKLFPMLQQKSKGAVIEPSVHKQGGAVLRDEQHVKSDEKVRFVTIGKVGAESGKGTKFGSVDSSHSPDYHRGFNTIL
eukprot:CAMPEP_0117451604 /NCGR_PEP_ID=MMETSP0759-20121206/9102_1 /TAXON_ID=63605 /ORGANISM="Percolomonas cosmopolitus, Strain WS" /LENGTH=169 /DNA_ID=CAMNT_0005244227 /DNA_START=406 /DNA_END=915 /DNA_ORIENTATION=+